MNDPQDGLGGMRERERQREREFQEYKKFFLFAFIF